MTLLVATDLYLSLSIEDVEVGLIISQLLFLEGELDCCLLFLTWSWMSLEIQMLFSNIWFSANSTFCVDKASYHTDVQTHEVDEGVLIVAANEHSHVSDENVLEAADDGGGECGVLCRAEDGGEDEDEAKDTGEEELGSEQGVGPPSKLWDWKHFTNFSKL